MNAFILMFSLIFLCNTAMPSILMADGVKSPKVQSIHKKKTKSSKVHSKHKKKTKTSKVHSKHKKKSNKMILNRMTPIYNTPPNNVAIPPAAPAPVANIQTPNTMPKKLKTMRLRSLQRTRQ